MYQIEERYLGQLAPTFTLTLAFDQRQKSRFRAILDSGEEVAVSLRRGGQPLRDGDCLRTTAGQVVRVAAQAELLTLAQTDDPTKLCQAAYHLGNRHIPVAIETGRLAYHHDHVLDEMVSKLGLALTTRSLPFEPESGAYGSGHAHVGQGHGSAAGKIHFHARETHEH